MDKDLFTGVVIIALRKALDAVDYKLLLKNFRYMASTPEC